MLKVGFAVALVAVSVVLLVPEAGSSHGSAVAQTTDVLLAFDTTDSMGPSIGLAQHEGKTLISDVENLVPGTHFAVASFRDRYSPSGEYSLLAGMTTDTNTIVDAIGKLKIEKSTRPDVDTYAEAYNKLFHETYSDTHIGWRADSRKIVIVIGDAEPHSAGVDGFPGCKDTTKDWDGYDTATELAAMRAAKRTLVMIRQAQTASTTLECYSSLAAAAYTGGTALDGNTTDIAKPVLALVEHAYAPLTVTPQFTRGVSGSTGGLTVSVANPNSFPLTLSTFTLTLPKGVSIVPGSSTGNLAAPVVQGGVLTWNRTAPLGRGQTLVDHVVLRVGKISSGLVSAQLKATPPDGTPLDVSSKAALRFVAHPKRVTLNANGQRGTLGLHGTVTSRLRLVGASGSLILNLAPQKSVTLRARSATVQRFGTETLLTMPIVVGKSTGVTGCAKGAVGVLHVVDWDALTASLRTHDRLSLKLPASCGGVKTFVDASARQPLTVKLDFA